MTELLFFLIGCACTLAVTLFVAGNARRSVERTPAPESIPQQPVRETLDHDATLDQPTSLLEVATTWSDEQDHLGAVVDSVGNELANLVSGVEGHAQILCEVVGEPDQVPVCAEQLWIAVRRLRSFSEKLLSYARPATPERRSTDLRGLFYGIRQEVEDHLAGAVQVRLQIGAALPYADTDGATLRHATMFLVDAILAVEPDASELVFEVLSRVEAETGADEDESAPVVEIRIMVDAEVAARGRDVTAGDVSLGYQAAHALLERIGGSLSFVHHAGLTTTASIVLPASAEAPEPPQETESLGDEAEHPYGGVLILEADPSIRSMLAREMAQQGRHTFRCTNGTAARSLFGATPERFELLILEEDARLESGADLAADALLQVPTTKVLLLVQGQPGRDLSDEYPGRWLAVRKPFGLMELREALVTLLGSGQRV